MEMAAPGLQLEKSESRNGDSEPGTVKHNCSDASISRLMTRTGRQVFFHASLLKGHRFPRSPLQARIPERQQRLQFQLPKKNR